MSAPPRPGTAERYEPGHGSAGIHVEHYDLDLAYKVRTNRLSGTATLAVRVRQPLKEVGLDLAGLTVEKVRLKGADLARYRHHDGKLVLRLTRKARAGDRLAVVVRYRGHPTPVASPWGPVGWDELEDGVVVANQPTGAPSWFPCHDRPGDKATYSTRLTVDAGYHVLAHGVLTAKRVRGSTTTWVYEQKHPTPTYLATVQVGRYREVALAKHPVPQTVLVPPALIGQADRHLARHGAMLRFFSTLFGPYPFPAYTLVFTPDHLEIPVEAQGVSVFGANHLAPVDGDGRLIPHELAHQWFGNSVSVSSWQHIWLNEGFATYAEWLWSEESGGSAADRLARLWHGRLARLPQDLVLADPGLANVFDDRVYKRGALTLHALRRVLGDRVFFDLVRTWTARHRDGTVTSQDFRELVVEHAVRRGGKTAARRVTNVLDAWLDETRLPALPRASR